MAELRFFITDLQGAETEVCNVISYEISKNIGAACDGVRLTFSDNISIGEIKQLYIYDAEKKIFNGYCDTQRESINASGSQTFIYARSSACILTDNEAKPYTYNSPSALSLFVENARAFGFECRLPMLYCTDDYQVKKGTSCYAAINDFVLGITGREIVINADNALELPQSDHLINLNEFNVISTKKSINRGSLVSRIDYKTDSISDYNHHIKSRYFEDIGVDCSRKINLSSLPKWQREYTVLNMLRSYNSSYNCFEILLDGCHNFSLYDEVVYENESFGKLKDYYISGVCCICDKNGERTRLVLNKNVDLREITYVAE